MTNLQPTGMRTLMVGTLIKQSLLSLAMMMDSFPSTIPSGVSIQGNGLDRRPDVYQVNILCFHLNLIQSFTKLLKSHKPCLSFC